MTNGTKKKGKLELCHCDSDLPASALELSYKLQDGYEKVTLPGPEGGGGIVLRNFTRGGANLVWNNTCKWQRKLMSHGANLSSFNLGAWEMSKALTSAPSKRVYGKVNSFNREQRAEPPRPAPSPCLSQE